MKKNLFVFLALVLGSMTVLTTSCNDDPCKDVECGANGSCFEGDCICNQGYEGSSCADEWTKKFVGNYAGEHTCDGITYVLNNPLVIARVDQSNIKLTNFLGQGNTSVINAVVSLKDAAATTALQFTVDGTDINGVKFKGVGEIADKKLTGTFDLTQGADTYKCSINYTMQ